MMIDLHFVMKSRCSRVHRFLGAKTSVMSRTMAKPYSQRGPCASATESTVTLLMICLFIEGSIALCPRCHKMRRAELAEFCMNSTLESESVSSCDDASSLTLSSFTVFLLAWRLRFFVGGSFVATFRFPPFAISCWTMTWTMALKSSNGGGGRCPARWVPLSGTVSST